MRQNIANELNYSYNVEKNYDRTDVIIYQCMQNVYINYVLICQPNWPNEMIYSMTMEKQVTAIGKCKQKNEIKRTWRIQWKLWFSTMNDVLFHIFLLRVWVVVVAVARKLWRLEITTIEIQFCCLSVFFKTLNEKNTKKKFSHTNELDTNSMQWFVIFQNDHF